MSGHGANLIFFDKKNKDLTSRTLADPHTPTFDNISFLPYPHPPLKVNVICLSPLSSWDGGFFKVASLQKIRRFLLKISLANLNKSISLPTQALTSSFPMHLFSTP